MRSKRFFRVRCLARDGWGGLRNSGPKVETWNIPWRWVSKFFQDTRRSYFNARGASYGSLPCGSPNLTFSPSKNDHSFQLWIFWILFRQVQRFRTNSRERRKTNHLHSGEHSLITYSSVPTYVMARYERKSKTQWLHYIFNGYHYGILGTHRGRIKVYRVI